MRLSSFLEVEGGADRVFLLDQPAALVGEVEGLSHVVETNVEADAPDGGQADFEAAAIIDSILGDLIAVIDGSAGREETAELHAAGGKGAHPRSYGGRVGQKIVKARVNGN